MTSNDEMRELADTELDAACGGGHGGFFALQISEVNHNSGAVAVNQAININSCNYQVAMAYA